MAEEQVGIVLTVKDQATSKIQAFARNAHRAFSSLQRRSVRMWDAANRGWNRFESGAKRFVRFTTRMTQGIGGAVKSVINLRNAFLLLGAAAAILGAIKALDLLIQRGSEVKRTTEAFVSLTGGVAGFGKELVTRTGKAVRGLIGDLDIMRSANRAVLLGIPVTAEKFAELSEAAVILGRAIGRGPVEALNDLTIGIGRQSRMILDNLGLIVSLEEANEKYARSVGKTTEDLTAMEQKLAFTTETIAKATEKAAQLGPIQEDVADHATRLKGKLSTLADTWSHGVVASGVFGRVLELLTGRMDEYEVSVDEAALATNRFILASLPAVGKFIKLVLWLKISWEAVVAVIYTLGSGLNTVLGFAIEKVTQSFAQLFDYIAQIYDLIPGMGGIADRIYEMTGNLRKFGVEWGIIFTNSATDNAEKAAQAIANLAEAYDELAGVDPMIAEWIRDLERFREEILKGSGAANDLSNEVQEINAAAQKVSIRRDFLSGLAVAREQTKQIVFLFAEFQEEIDNLRGELGTAMDAPAIAALTKDLDVAEEKMALFARTVGGAMEGLAKKLPADEFQNLVNVARQGGGLNEVEDTVRAVGYESQKTAFFVEDLTAAVEKGNLSLPAQIALYGQAEAVLSEYGEELREKPELLERLKAAMEALEADPITAAFSVLETEMEAVGKTVSSLTDRLNAGNLSVAERNKLFEIASTLMEQYGNDLPVAQVEALQYAIDRLRPDAAVETLRAIRAENKLLVSEAREFAAQLQYGNLSLAEQSDLYDAVVGNLDRLKLILGETSAEYQSLLEVLERTQGALEEASETSFLEVMGERLGLFRDELGNLRQDLKGGFADLFAGVVVGFSAMAADVIVGAQTLSEGVKNLLKSTARAAIQMLIQMGVQRLILMIKNKAATVTEASSQMAAGLSQVFVNSFASAAAIPIVGWAMAPAVAAANLAAATAGATAAAATGAGLGAAAGGAAEGAFISGATTVNVGEGNQPELILPLASSRARRAVKDSGLAEALGSERGDSVTINLGGLTLSAPVVLDANANEVPTPFLRSLGQAMETLAEDGLLRSRKKGRG